MPRDSRSYRHRSASRSKSRSPTRHRGSPDRTRNRDRTRAKRSRSREKRRISPHHRRDRKRSRSKEKDRSKVKRLLHSRPPLKLKLAKDLRSRGRDKRSRSGSPDKKRIKSKSPVNKEGALTVKDEPLDKEAEQKRLEMEMQKRRERIEQWREKRKPKLEPPPAINIAPPSRVWTLEDEDDDDEENGGDPDGEKGAEPDVDPLDAYMKAVTDEVKQIKAEKEQKSASSDAPTVKKVDATAANGKGKVTIITAVAKKTTVEPSTRKGELMESNMDALEYSSEEEQEDLEDAMTRLAKKKKVPTATLR